MRYTDHFDADDYPALPHSGLGIASFLLSSAMGILEFILVIIAGVLQTSTEGGIDENSPAAILLGSALIGGLMLDLMGIGLGIAGLCDHKRNKLFAILGVVIGSVVLSGVLFLIVISIAMG